MKRFTCYSFSFLHLLQAIAYYETRHFCCIFKVSHLEGLPFFRQVKVFAFQISSNTNSRKSTTRFKDWFTWGDFWTSSHHFWKFFLCTFLANSPSAACWLACAKRGTPFVELVSLNLSLFHSPAGTPNIEKEFSIIFDGALYTLFVRASKWTPNWLIYMSGLTLRFPFMASHSQDLI